MGTPSAAQNLWLTARMASLRHLLRTAETVSTSELKDVLYAAQLEVDSICVEFASLVWAKGVVQPDLVSVPQEVDWDHSGQDDWTSDVSDDGWDAGSEHSSSEVGCNLSEDSGSKWVQIASAPKQKKATTKQEKVAPIKQKAPTPSPKIAVQCARPVKPVKTTNRRGTKALSLNQMSKAEYKRRFKQSKKGKKKKAQKNAAYTRVSTHKELMRYLADNHFVKSSDSRGGETRFTRAYCACGGCPLFQPSATCGKPLSQFTGVVPSGSRIKGKYYQNKRTDVDKLTSQAQSTYNLA